MTPLKDLVDEKDKELSRIYWHNESDSPEWYWENSGQEYRDDFIRMARHTLTSEIICRIDECKNPQIYKYRIKKLNDMLEELEKL